MILFETERLVIRELEENDLNDFYRLNSDEEVMRYIRKPRTFIECETLIRETIENRKIYPGFGRHAVIEKATGVYVGSFSLIPLEGTTDFHLGYAFFKEYQGKGFATEVTRGSLPFVFTTINREIIKAITIPANTASQNVLLKSGFIETGRMIHQGEEVLVFELKRSESVKS